MKKIVLMSALILAACISGLSQSYDADLAKKLGADERGMKMYVLCILKTGPKDSEIKGKDRDALLGNT